MNEKNVSLFTAAWNLLGTWIRYDSCRTHDARLKEATEISPERTGSTGCDVPTHWDRRSAQDKAKQLRARFTNKCGEFDLTGLVDHEGAVVVYEERGKPMYFDSERRRYVITMPYGTCAERDAYVIATHVGRLAMMLPLEGREDPDVKARNFRLCSMFAAELLLPEDEVRKRMAEGDDAYAIAARFGVLHSAAEVRMHILKTKRREAMDKKKKRLVLVIEERVRYFYHLDEGEYLDEAKEDAWKAYGEGALKGEVQECNMELIEEDA